MKISKARLKQIIREELENLDQSDTSFFAIDIDNNGFIDIVESESKIWRPGNWTGNSNSIRYEWNGTKFQKIN